MRCDRHQKRCKDAMAISYSQKLLMGTILNNKPNSDTGSRIYKYIYLQIQDLLAEKLISRDLYFNLTTKEHMAASGNLDLSFEIDDVVFGAQDKFGFDDRTRTAYEMFFKDCLSQYSCCVLNRLNLILFNPFCMSPMVMFFLASKVVAVRYSSELGVTVSDFFLQMLNSYNLMLDMPLDDVVINAMHAKYIDDEHSISMGCSIWVENYNEACKNREPGLIWFSNEFDSEIDGHKNSQALWEKLSCQVYEDIKLQSMYQVCINSGHQPQSSELQKNVFSLYILLFDRLVSNFQLDYYGIGVIPLFGQMLFTSIALHDDQVVRIDVMNITKNEMNDRVRGLLLETASDVVMNGEEMLADDISQSLIHNYKHIANLVCN